MTWMSRQQNGQEPVNPKEATSIKETAFAAFRKTYKWILGGVGFLELANGIIAASILWFGYSQNDRAIQGHITRNAAFMALFANQMGHIAWGVSFLVNAFTLAHPERQRDVIVSPRAMVRVRCAICFMWSLNVALTYSSQIGGVPGALAYTAVVLFVTIACVPGIEDVIAPTHVKYDVITIINTWKAEFAASTVFYPVVAIACAFLAQPQGTYNPTYYTLIDNKFGYYYVVLMTLIISGSMLIYFVVILLLWSCRKDEYRNMLVSTATGQKVELTFDTMTPRMRTELYAFQGLASAQTARPKPSSKTASRSPSRSKSDSPSRSKSDSRSESRSDSRSKSPRSDSRSKSPRSDSRSKAEKPEPHLRGTKPPKPRASEVHPTGWPQRLGRAPVY
jgi:hypothetical protein